MTRRGVLLCGGGTGGHLYPPIAVGEALRECAPDLPIRFVAGGCPPDLRAFEGSGLDVVHMRVPRWQGWLRAPATAWRLVGVLREAGRILDDFRPAAVVGGGGYVSFPCAFRAAGRGIPLFLLEQNAVPGRVTGWLVARARAVCLSFDSGNFGDMTESRFLDSDRVPGFRASVVTGNPVRAAVVRAAESEIPKSSPVLLVAGGSQGARALNRGMIDAAPFLGREVPGLRVLHLAGPDTEEVRAAYRAAGIDAEVRDFHPEPWTWASRADLALSRAGGTAIAEFLTLGLPMLLVPLPGSKDDHQAANARAVASGGACVVLSQDRLGGELAARLSGLLKDPGRLGSLRASALRMAQPDAAARVARLVLEGIGEAECGST